MLTADQISALRDRSEQLLDPVINFLIEDIARRVKEAGQLTGTASYQTWRLQHLGMSQRQLKKEIAKRLEISLADAEKLLTQAAETGYNFDISRFPNTQAIPLSANSSLQQILAATVAQAREDLTNMTQTMGFVGADGICRPLTQAYQQACDFAFQKISTGAQDYVSAIRDATWGLAEKGIRTIDYKSGYHISIEAAVRQNMMGGMGIMQNHIAQNNHDTLGCNGWEISAHENSAPDHEPIQGKQYSDAEYEALNNSLTRRIGTLHCGHYASPIILGVHSPQYTDEELEDMRRRNEEGVTFDGRHYTGFEATQRQRKFERSIRKQQRRILIDETVEDTTKLQTDQIRLQRLKQEYKRFSDGVGLPMQYERLDTAGFTWKHAKAAEKSARSKGQMDPDESQTRKQYANYKGRLASRMSEMEYDDFFKLKKTGGDEWDKLQYDYRYTGIIERLIEDNKNVVVCNVPEDIPDSYHDAAKGLSTSQKNGLYHYSHYDEGVKMNKALGYVPGIILTPEEQLSLDQTVDALNHMTLPKNTVIWRGTKPNLLKGFEKLDPKNLGSWKMKELSMDGFTSTSILKSAAYNDKPVQMVILAPGNMPGAGYIDDVSYNLAHLGETENGRKLSQEYEILLQKGSRFSIIEAQRFKDKTILVVKWEGGNT